MRYRVVVGSFKDKNHAALKARAVNAEAPDMQASVAERRPGNEFYAVVVGDYMPAAEAAALLIKACTLKSVPRDSFLSKEPRSQGPSGG